MDTTRLKNILEAILLAADRVLTVLQLEALFELDEERPTRDEIRKALHEMADDYETRGYELKQVASGFRLQVKQEYANWVGRLWEERPARYTRALLETMALIAYRQPITRGEIEEVRGVSVSSNIIKTLLERDWIKVLGHKDVPGKPALYGTTKEFLDYFNLQSLDQLPTLAELKDLDSIHPELEFDDDAENASTDSTNDDDSAETQEKHNEDQSDSEPSADDVSLHGAGTVEASDENQLDEVQAAEHAASADSVAEDLLDEELVAEDYTADEQQETEKQVFNA